MHTVTTLVAASEMKHKASNFIHLSAPTIETITYKRQKQCGHRELMLENLPVGTIEHRSTRRRAVR